MPLVQLGLNICTTLSHLTAPFITTFLLVHLPAPAIATLGGSGLSSQVMLFGREYYQVPFIESWLVFAPLSLHICAGILKRILLTFDSRDNYRSRKFSFNLLTVTAYPLVIFLSIHVLTHRLIPASSAAPIQALSPSELDYDFVKVGIKTWPWRSTFLYGGLLISTALHSLEGVNVILRTWFPKAKRLSTLVKRLITDALVSSVTFGLICIAREPFPTLLKITSERILASYRSLWVYKM